MQKKLLRLQNEHLDAFKGSSLGDIAAPKVSKLEKEKLVAQEKAKAGEPEVKKSDEKASW